MFSQAEEKGKSSHSLCDEFHKVENDVITLFQKRLRTETTHKQSTAGRGKDKLRRRCDDVLDHDWQSDYQRKPAREIGNASPEAQPDADQEPVSVPNIRARRGPNTGIDIDGDWSCWRWCWVGVIELSLEHMIVETRAMI